MIIHASGRDKPSEALAFWDTGANISVISRELAHAINPKTLGFSKMRGITGSDYLPQYLIDLELPNHLKITDLLVSESVDLGRNKNGVPFGILVGMDIIQKGDFALSHSDGFSSMSFRMPSIVHTDFVEEYNRTFPPQSE